MWQVTCRATCWNPHFLARVLTLHTLHTLHTLLTLLKLHTCSLRYLRSPSYLPNLYVRSLNWALRDERWGNSSTPADTYALFWYASGGAGPFDSPRCLDMQPLSVLSVHGQQQALLARVLGASQGHSLSVFDAFEVSPANLTSTTTNEESAGAFGFAVGNATVVVAMIVDQGTYANHANLTLTMDFSPVFGFEAIMQPKTCLFLPAPTGGPAVELKVIVGAAASTGSVTVPISAAPLLEARNFGGASDPWDAAVMYVTCSA
jgi:hypothetical protein